MHGRKRLHVVAILGATGCRCHLWLGSPHADGARKGNKELPLHGIADKEHWPETRDSALRDSPALGFSPPMAGCPGMATRSLAWSGFLKKGISTHYRQRVDVPDTRFAGTDRIRTMHCALEARRPKPKDRMVLSAVAE